MTKEELEGIKTTWAAATPGPWCSEIDEDCPDDVRVCYVAKNSERCEWCIALSGDCIEGSNGLWTPETLARWRADAKAIAAAPAHIAKLVAEVERLQKQLFQVSEKYGRVLDCFGD